MAPPDTPFEPDAVIIGAGIIGCAIALALSRAGFRTLNVDRHAAAGYGSTSSSAAIIRPYYSTVEGTALAYEGHHVWSAWRDFLASPADEELARYIQCGCMVLMPAGPDRLSRTRATLAEVGVPFEILTASEVEARAPGICLDSFAPPRRIDDDGFGVPNAEALAGAILCPGGYVNDPQLACRNLMHAAIRHGARFRFNAEVAAITQAEGRCTGLVLEGGETIAAPVVVNAAGPHSGAINRLAGVDATMGVATRPLRVEVVHADAPEGLDIARVGVVTDADAGVYSRPEGDRHMLIGSLEPACDVLEWVAPDGFDTSPTEQWTNQIWRAAQRFPSLRIPNTASGFVALYDVSDDWIPIYDRADLDGFFMAVGTSGNQFKNAPVVGEMMAGLIAHCLAGGDHDAEPFVFDLRHQGRTLDMRAFSRRRSANAKSSFSVLG